MARAEPRLTRRAVLGAGLGVAAARGGQRSRAAAASETDATVETWLARLSTAEKVARLFMVPVAETALTPQEDDWLRTHRPGGVILTEANVGTPDDVAALIAAIHATNPALPPLVAVDQEGGPVTRLAGDPAPGAAALGAMSDAEVRRLSRARAEFLAGFGVDVNFAPVADVADGPDSFMAGRTFGDDPTLVAAKVAAAVEGAAGTGVCHTAKHFPGHGRATIDSHLALPTVDLSRAVWAETDGLPFRAAVVAGVPLVMLGHLLYPQWDDAPASISPVAVDVLRDDLGFAGVVVTDDLGMDALSFLDPRTVVDRAIAAGVDLLLYVAPPVPSADLIAHLVERVESGDLPRARIDASLRRLLGLRVDQPR